MDNGLSFVPYYNLGGIRLADLPKIEDATTATNMRKTNSGSWRARDGYSKFSSTNLTAVNGLYFSRRSGKALAYANGKFYTAGINTTWQDITSSVTTGTLTVTNGSRTITGASTSFSYLDEGKPIVIDGNSGYYVSYVSTAAVAYLSKSYSGTSGASKAYTLGFTLFTPTDLYTRGEEHDGILCFSNGVDKNLKFDGDEICLLGVMPPEQARYATGTVTATLNSTTVTGSGTTWINAYEGQLITINVSTYKVVSIASSTSLIIDRPFTGATSAGYAYEIRYNGIQGIPSRYSTGKVITTNGSAVIRTTSGATFDAKYAGRVILVSGVGYSVLRVSGTQYAILNSNYAGTTSATGKLYYIENPGVIGGRHFYAVTYVNRQGAESNPSFYSANVDTYAGKVDLWLPMPPSGAGVVTKRIYRTLATQQFATPVTTVTWEDNTLPTDVTSHPPVGPGGGGGGIDLPQVSPRITDLGGLAGPRAGGSVVGGLLTDRGGFGTIGGSGPRAPGISVNVGGSVGSTALGVVAGGQAPPATPGVGGDQRIFRASPINIITAPPADTPLYFLTEVDSNVTTYTDNTSDENLGFAAARDNGTPPVFSGVMSTGGRLWGWSGNRIHWSKVGFMDSYSPLSFVNLPEDGDGIQKCIRFGSGVYIFRRRDIWFTEGPGSPITPVSDKGTVSGDSVVEAGGTIYYFGDDGLRQFNGMSSSLVDTTVDLYTNKSLWKKARAAHDTVRNEVYWTVGSITSGSTMDRILVLNYRHGVISLFNVTATALLWLPEFGELVHGYDYVFFHDDNDDDGTAITWTWKSGAADDSRVGHSSLEALIVQCKNSHHLTFTVNAYVDFRSTQAVSYSVYADAGDSPLWGTSLWGQFLWDDRRYVFRRVDLDVAGNRHQIELTGTIEKFEFLGFEVGYRRRRIANRYAS